jgi:hypothetical protein
MRRDGVIDMDQLVKTSLLRVLQIFFFILWLILWH